MISTLILRNYRGFEEHEIPLKRLSVIVGRNNAGKSSIVEALRIVSLVTNRYKNLQYRDPPRWTDLPRRLVGCAPSLRDQGINFAGLCFQYRDSPAVIEARFENRSKVAIYVGGEDQIHAVIYDETGHVATSVVEARQILLPTVAIMPQVAPVLETERLLSEDYVRGAMSSRLASLHFRNQLRLLPELSDALREAVEETWPGVRVGELLRQGRAPDMSLQLQVRNEDFVADVFNMGHGLQMWLQAMWFLVRSKDASTVILDEPDVYMHADLQRRLIRYVRPKFPQLILATHSVEIMAEVEPEDVLVVDRRRPASSFATSLPSVQRIITRIGSTHNLHLTRLWSAQRMLLVEGKDLGILKRIQNRLYANSKAPFDAIPNMSIGGWGGWSFAVGTALALRNAVGEEVITYCILDSDFHTQAEIDRRLADARERQVSLHVWRFKEIENYLLVPAAIARVIAQRAARGEVPTRDDVDRQIIAIAETLRDEAFDATAAEILGQNRQLGAGGANREARTVIEARIAAAGGLQRIVSGKEIISQLSNWAQTRNGVSLNPGQIANELRENEIHADLEHVVRSVERFLRF